MKNTASIRMFQALLASVEDDYILARKKHNPPPTPHLATLVLLNLAFLRHSADVYHRWLVHAIVGINTKRRSCLA